LLSVQEYAQGTTSFNDQFKVQRHRKYER